MKQPITPKTRAADDPRNAPIALRCELVELGYTDRAIARLCDAAVLAKVRRGAYCDGPTHARLDDIGQQGLVTRAVVKQAKTEVVVSHVAAAIEHDCPIWGFDLSETDVTRTDGRVGRREAGVRQHAGRIADGDVVELNGLKVMSATRTALEVTITGSLESALIVVCDLLHRGRTTLEELADRYASMAMWPATLKTDVVLRLARTELASVGEVRSWVLLYRAAIPMPELQHAICDPHTGELVALLDFAWPDLGVYLEFDGRLKYEKYLRPGERAGDAVFREKQREDRIRRITGWRCIRITWADLEHPARTAEMIRRVLAEEAAARSGRTS